jgi:D-lactate dehydrogenase (cytochrome)
MITKTAPDQIQDYLSDASYMRGGFVERVVLPRTIDEVVEVLKEASASGTSITVSGAGTGTVGGRVAFGGVLLATDKLNRIISIDRRPEGGGALAESGVVLSDLQRAVDLEGLLYPPDPTERSCFLGGTVSTNASGSRTFKYGPTRKYVERLTVVLATGEVLNLERNQLRADGEGKLRVPLDSGRVIEVLVPRYQMPATRKNATGYFVQEGMDAIDLFIGSEGTLGVIVEVGVRLLPKPEGLLSGVVFFERDSDVLKFVNEARKRSLETRAESSARGRFDARALEFFDRESLRFLREKYSTVPETAAGAIFFEQETNAESEESLMGEWLELLDRHHAFADSWFATNEQDLTKLREFRHQLPVLMNEWFAKYGQKKVSTDMALPDSEFAGMFRLYQECLRESGLRYTIFGHIGDNHVHVNILPRDEAEGIRAREFYVEFLKYAAAHGGTLSAEHGVGKLKRDYLKYFYSDSELREMARVKLAFDPDGILGRGNIFSEELLIAQ